jgi:hypothetical protein
MTGQGNITRSVRALAGSILLGPGLFVLWGNVVWAGSRVSDLLAEASGKGLGLLPSVVLVAPVDQRWLWQSLIRMLWPVLLVIAGAMLLSDESPEGSLGKYSGYQAKDFRIARRLPKIRAQGFQTCAIYCWVSRNG